MNDSHPASARRTRRARTAPRVSVIGVLGELLMTAGVIALLFVVWQLWVGDMIIGSQKHAEATALSQQWAQSPSPATPTPTPDATTAPEPDGAVIPVPTAPGHAQEFGVMHVPRFGADWRFAIASGVTRKDILDKGDIGHYEDTPMPGAVGNTVYAAHRWTSGEPFDPVDRLIVGDPIVIETPDGWYTYRFRTTHYVQASQVDVLLPVPEQEGVTGNGRYLTLTSCAPKLNMRERIISYAVFDRFTPRADGPPASLTEGSTT